MFQEIEKIKREVAKKWGCMVSDLEGPRKSKMRTRARQEAMARIRKETKCSLPEIGYFFGRRHHTTVLHACKVYKRHPEYFR